MTRRVITVALIAIVVGTIGVLNSVGGPPSLGSSGLASQHEQKTPYSAAQILVGATFGVGPVGRLLDGHGAVHLADQRTARVVTAWADRYFADNHAQAEALLSAVESRSSTRIHEALARASTGLAHETRRYVTSADGTTVFNTDTIVAQNTILIVDHVAVALAVTFPLSGGGAPSGLAADRVAVALSHRL
jgi:hypothetical protein